MAHILERNIDLRTSGTELVTSLGKLLEQLLYSCYLKKKKKKKIRLNSSGLGSQLLISVHLF